MSFHPIDSWKRSFKMERYIEEEITLRELAKRLKLDNDLNTPEIYNVEDEGYEIQSQDKNGNIVWKPITHYVVKNNVQKHYRLGTLCGTEEHCVLLNNKYIPLKSHPDTQLIEKPIQVVDITVPETHNYLAEGQINHNTTVPGGMAIPYASSTRIRLMSAKPIEKNGEPIGVQVEARTIKNKVATPFRKCTFSIYFGVGIVEHEEVFDLFRGYCDKSKNGVTMPNGESVSVSGKSAWKNFMVTGDQGEVLHEVKFHKADFAKKVLNVPEYKDYLEALYEATLVLKKGAREDDNPTIDKPNMNSAMEMEAVAMEAKDNE